KTENPYVSLQISSDIFFEVWLRGNVSVTPRDQRVYVSLGLSKHCGLRRPCTIGAAETCGGRQTMEAWENQTETKPVEESDRQQKEKS
ncbi:unnamed protein product, partial [Pleuronectes platessa]